ncbi:MAG: hypothetical protein ACLUVG_23615 [Phocaeicola vulgatus]
MKLFAHRDEDKARYLIFALQTTPSAVARGDSERQYSHRGERYFVCALCGAQGNCSVLYNMPISEFKAERERSMEV